MKSLIISAVIGVLLVAGSVAHSVCLEKISAQLAEESVQLREGIENNNYEEALATADKIGSFVSEKRTVLEATGKHNEIDEIEIAVRELTAYIKTRSMSDALAKCGEVEFLCIHLPSNFKLKIENIL